MDRIRRLTLTLARKTARSDLARNLVRDLKSMRALWNWIYMALYVWVCVWTVLYHPDVISTVVTVTGGVVSVIFSGYVLSRAYEKAKNSGDSNGHSPDGGENGDSD